MFMLSVCRTPPLKLEGVVMIPFTPVHSPHAAHLNHDHNDHNDDSNSDLIFMLSVCRTPPLKLEGVVMIPFRPTPFFLNDSTTVATLELWDCCTSLSP